jgi:predicted metalloprotease
MVDTQEVPMRLGGRRSTNIEDRRSLRVGRAGGIGVGTIVLALVALYFGQDPAMVLQMVEQGVGTMEEQVPYEESESEAQARDLVSVVLADTEDTWSGIFAAAGGTYRKPKLVLFSQAVESACGRAASALGPFYCPADEKVYIDLTFYHDLRDRFGAPGDFAQAYVIAHEIGHHVQKLLGVFDQVEAARGRITQAQANQLSVRQELQADCFAGIWAHHANRSRQILEAGDVEEGLNAASAIGDDRLTQGRVSPESFTHGTSAQRVRWFKRGLKSGSLDACDTFAAPEL